jgi:hypothetical protein
MNQANASDGGSLIEAAAVGVAGAALGAVVGSSLGLAVPLGAIGAANGAITGWRRVYDWGCSSGPIAFVLDSTWALPMTGAALASQALGIVRGAPGYDESMSRRANRLVFRRGFVPRSGFAITIGNVVSGAGDTSLPRRRKLVTDHEDVHVWQARWLGPLYPLLYGGWMVVGGAAGVVVWAARRRDESLARVVESCAYYLNPFEWWAYSRDDHWPPTGKVRGLGWRTPIVGPRRHQPVGRSR